MSPASHDGRQGFTLIEVMAAMVILTVGLLGLAASSTFMSVQVRVAGLRSHRMAAVAEAAESMRLTNFDGIVNRAAGSAVAYDGYNVWWNVTNGASVNGQVNFKSVAFITRGPGYVLGHGWSTTAADTFVVSFFRPFGS